MTTHCASKEIQSTEDFKQQNEHYWKIIEKQRVIIQTLQKTLTNLSNENEYLVKRNKELEAFTPVVYPTPGFDSANVTHHPLAEITTSPTTHPMTNVDTTPATTNSTPVPPPRSPYRVHHGNINHHHQHPHDMTKNQTQQQQQPTYPLVNLPKRPPVLKLAMSNHSLLYSRAVGDAASGEYLVSPGRVASNPSSPLSMTASSSNIDNSRPSFEYSDQNSSPYSSKYSTPCRASISPNGHSTVVTNEQDRSNHHRRESASQYERTNLDVEHNSTSEPSTPIKPRTPRFDSLMSNQNKEQAPPTVLSNLSNIHTKVISSSINTDEKGKEVPVFVIGIQQKDDLKNEIWRIEKSLVDIINLDANLKEGATTAHGLKKLPDKSLFTSHAPAKVDERKNMIEEYLWHAITLKTINLVILCEFLSSDRIHNLPITSTNDIGIKQGYLTKRGKNFGGWKSRYFVLDNTGLLKYYESKDGQFLGTIKLIDSQIGCQATHQDDHYRHAFLILEPKTNGSHHRHIFCVESDQDRDVWVDALRYYANQLHITEDVMNSSFSDDTMMMDHLVIEPSSSTDSAKTAPTIRKRPSMDYIFNYFQSSSGTRRRSSNSLPLSSPIHDEQQENDEKKSKYRTSKRTFWGKKMFGSNSSAADMLPPTSPHGTALGSPQDFKYIQAINDYEETRGDRQVFGIPLESAVMVARVWDQYELPAIVHRCIEYMEMKDALIEEGIYRLSGSAAFVKKLKKRFNDEGDVRLLEDREYHDVHAIAGLLKMWLRELPENILTDALLGEFLHSVDLEDNQSKVFEVGRLVSFLPLVNYTLLRSLSAHLIRVIENSDKNKMTLRNISIVFSATLGIPSSIFNLLLVEFDYIFWTDRCTAEDQMVPATECTIKTYMQDLPDEEEDDEFQYQHSLVQNFKRQESFSRSKRNSIHYQDNTPKDFISLEKQLNAVIDDIPTPYDDEPYYSDGELEVAYFASRYNANSKNTRKSLEEIRSAI